MLDFGVLLEQALHAESATNCDDTEGYAFQPVCTLAAPIPMEDAMLSPNPPIPPASINPPILQGRTASNPSHEPPSKSSNAFASSGSTVSSVGSVTPLACSRRHPPKNGTVEMLYRKGRSKQRRKKKRSEIKESASYGDYAVKQSIISRRINGHIPLHQTSIDAIELSHVSTGYLGWRDEGGFGKVFSLEEALGMGFEYKHWDGRCVG